MKWAYFYPNFKHDLFMMTDGTSRGAERVKKKEEGNEFPKIPEDGKKKTFTVYIILSLLKYHTMKAGDSFCCGEMFWVLATK